VSLALGGATFANTGLGNPNGISFLSATISDNTSVIAAAKYQVDKLRLYAGYEWNQFANASDTITSFTDIAGDQVTAGVNGTKVASSAAFVHGDKIQQLVWTGAKYAITDSLDVTGAYYHVWQNDFSGGLAPAGTVNTCAQVSTIQSSCAGSIDAASILLDWKFAPKWDTYIGTLYSKFSGGTDNGMQVSSAWTTTAGVRFRW
jgi:predicted porin